MVLLMVWNPTIQSCIGLGGDGSEDGWNPTNQSCIGQSGDVSVGGCNPTLLSHTFDFC